MLQHEDGTTSVSVFHDELRRRLEEYVVHSRGLFSVSSARPVLTTMHKLVSKVMAQRYAPPPKKNLCKQRRPRQRGRDSSRDRVDGSACVMVHQSARFAAQREPLEQDAAADAGGAEAVREPEHGGPHQGGRPTRATPPHRQGMVRQERLSDMPQSSPVDVVCRGCAGGTSWSTWA